MNSEPKKTSPGSSKKQPSTGNHRDTLLTPATPNFNVVIESAEHHQQKWLFFEGHQTQNSEGNIEVGDGGGHDLCGVVLHGMAVFFEEPGIVLEPNELRTRYIVCRCLQAT